VLADPALAEGDQIVVFSERVLSLEIENVELEVAFDDTLSIINAEAGFLVAKTDLIINNDIREPLTLVPGINRIVLELADGSQRIVLNIEWNSYPSILNPAINSRAIAVDVDDTTLAIGDTLYELDGFDIDSSHYIGSEIDVSDQTVVIASRERPQDGVWVYERMNGEWDFLGHIKPDLSKHLEGMGQL